ncbi:hypothetical protein ACFOZ0_08070 [Streptomyces yaanensis]|uniref:Uncharacterized protein n=1 Tax=Streptomyces yaanensis TaxID=1142239 RepID=A0ABV7SCV4_9ACTN|nr:hypothetical protein [Streptomyces sp. CGMCC 4.7035]WNC02733.1 hypothetical protein Q2K21_34335 [Streptomyces sp. CGMCC 4.7035]
MAENAIIDHLATQRLTADQLAERVAATREALRERMARRLTDEKLDQGPGVSANLYALAAGKIRARGSLSWSKPMRGQSARGR